MKHSIPFLSENVDNTSVFKVTERFFDRKQFLPRYKHTKMDGDCGCFIQVRRY